MRIPSVLTSLAHRDSHTFFVMALPLSFIHRQPEITDRRDSKVMNNPLCLSMMAQFTLLQGGGAKEFGDDDECRGLNLMEFTDMVLRMRFGFFDDVDWSTPFFLPWIFYVGGLCCVHQVQSCCRRKREHGFYFVDLLVEFWLNLS